jgi:predicted transcriptional regulator
MMVHANRDLNKINSSKKKMGIDEQEIERMVQLSKRQIRTFTHAGFLSDELTQVNAVIK